MPNTTKTNWETSRRTALCLSCSYVFVGDDKDTIRRVVNAAHLHADETGHTLKLVEYMTCTVGVKES